LQAGSSYLSSEDPRLHFGLDRTASVKALVVHLPGGRTIRRDDVAANQVVTIPG
jgi:ASPIC and UnbV